MTVNAPPFKAGPAPRRIRPARHAAAAALLTLALGLTATFAASRSLQNAALHAAQARFEQTATLATADLRRSLLGAAAILRGARGFASALAAPQSGAAWRGYLASLDLDGLQSPVRSLGRIEPGAAIGDLSTRQALRRAAETGKVALAANALQDSTDAAIARTALTLYLPIYANGEDVPLPGPRHASATGYVYASLNPDRLVDASVLGRLHMEIIADDPAGKKAKIAKGVVETITQTTGLGSDEARKLRGKVAIANAKMAYQWYLDFIKSDRWQALAAKGAMPQRLLWASTSTKDPSYPDTLYVDTLIGKDTVNTIPPATMDAFRDHGTPKETLTADIDGAKHVLAEAERLGLDLDGVTETLVEEGVQSFAKAFDELLGSIAAKHPAAA